MIPGRKSGIGFTAIKSRRTTDTGIGDRCVFRQRWGCYHLLRLQGLTSGNMVGFRIECLSEIEYITAQFRRFSKTPCNVGLPFLLIQDGICEESYWLSTWSRDQKQLSMGISERKAATHSIHYTKQITGIQFPTNSNKQTEKFVWTDTEREPKRRVNIWNREEVLKQSQSIFFRDIFC